MNLVTVRNWIYSGMFGNIKIADIDIHLRQNKLYISHIQHGRTNDSDGDEGNESNEDKDSYLSPSTRRSPGSESSRNVWAACQEYDSTDIGHFSKFSLFQIVEVLFEIRHLGWSLSNQFPVILSSSWMYPGIFRLVNHN